jgi:hypothetical protein
MSEPVPGSCRLSHLKSARHCRGPIPTIALRHKTSRQLRRVSFTNPFTTATVVHNRDGVIAASASRCQRDVGTREAHRLKWWDRCRGDLRRAARSRVLTPAIADGFDGA